MAKSALHYGIHIGQLQEGTEMRLYMESRKEKKDKSIRLLNGYVFIFSKSKRLITMYRLPEELLLEWDEVKPIQNDNRLKYKEMKRKGIKLWLPKTD